MEPVQIQDRQVTEKSMSIRWASNFNWLSEPITSGDMISFKRMAQDRGGLCATCVALTLQHPIGVAEAGDTSIGRPCVDEAICVKNGTR